MTTFFFSHTDCYAHQTGPGHPESSQRLAALIAAIEEQQFTELHDENAPLADDESILRVHSAEHLEKLLTALPGNEREILSFGADILLSKDSLLAARRAAGAAIASVDAVMSGRAQNAFCAIRPPGHHATRNRAMGFCLFNNAAIASFHARAAFDAQRVAVIDFDVHHGNGTQDIFWDEPDFFYGSTHQGDFYPGTGEINETGCNDNICNAPLRHGDAGEHFRAAMNDKILPALDSFSPDLIIISAGFDAHADDPLGGLYFLEEDFRWATLKLADLAHKHASGRMVSLLEGGYDEAALANCAVEHVKALLQSGS